MQREFAGYQSVVGDAGGLLRAGAALDGGETEGSLLGELNRGWGQACTGLQDWEHSLRTNLLHCQVRAVVNGPPSGNDCSYLFCHSPSGYGFNHLLH